MTNESILLIGRKDSHAREVYKTHADRLRNKAGVGEVRVATYETEPVRELRKTFTGIESDHVYAVPLTTAHTFDTTDGIPAALSYVSGEVHYCEPVGRSPAITNALAQRASDVVRPGADTSLVLVGFGSSSKPYQRQTTEYHAARLSNRSNYDEVLTCYLLQNPAVECVRYNTSNARTVAVPLFLTRSRATEEKIPAKLELDRGGIGYADPLGEHSQVTDAIHAEVEKQRVLAASEDGPASFETRLTQNCRPVATDGEGVRR